VPGERTREVMLDPEPLRTLWSETKGQAGACPDRTRAIPCTVQAVTGCQLATGTARTACPLRARSAGQSRVLTVTPGQPGMPVDLRTGRLTRCANRPSKQPVAGSNPAGRAVFMAPDLDLVPLPCQIRSLACRAQPGRPRRSHQRASGVSRRMSAGRSGRRGCCYGPCGPAARVAVQVPGGHRRRADLIPVRHAGLAKCHYRGGLGCGCWADEVYNADLRRQWVPSCSFWRRPPRHSANGGS
jgi:hypothetical protein